MEDATQSVDMMTIRFLQMITDQIEPLHISLQKMEVIWYQNHHHHQLTI